MGNEGRGRAVSGDSSLVGSGIALVALKPKLIVPPDA
jgi:hypothetical protein